MTSSTDPGTSSRRSRGGRREPVGRLRRWTQVVLVVGSLLAVAAAFGPVWAVRTGVVVAVVTSILACTLAWRETFGERRRHARDLHRAHHEHGVTLSSERQRNAEVVDTLTERLRSSGMLVAGQRGTISQLRGEVGVLRAQCDRLTEQVVERDGLLGLFRGSLREQEAALLAVREAEQLGVAQVAGGAEVHSLPRRADRAAESVGSAESEESVLDPAMAELAMVLPNYEATRRVG